MKISIISSSDKLGGTELSSLRICRVLKENKIDCVMIAPGSSIQDELDFYGINLLNCPMKRTLWGGIKSILALHSIVVRNKIDILHCQDAYSAIIACFVKKLFRAHFSIIWHVRGIHAQSYSKMVKYSKYINVAVCNGYYERMLLVFNGYPINRTKVIYNGIEKPSYDKSPQILRKELSIHESDFVVGTLGRLTFDKGIEYLIKSVALIHDDNIKLLVVGDGVERQNLEQLAKKLKIGNRVIFTGFRRDTADLYRVMDLFAFPSLYESFGNVAVEAMLSKTLVLASKVGGIQEIIANDVNGFLLYPAEIQAWADKIFEIKSHKGAYSDLIERAYNDALRKFGFERLCNELIDIYKELLS